MIDIRVDFTYLYKYGCKNRFQNRRRYGICIVGIPRINAKLDVQRSFLLLCSKISGRNESRSDIPVREDCEAKVRFKVQEGTVNRDRGVSKANMD